MDQTLVVKTSTGYTQYLKELDSLKFEDGHEIQWEISPSALPVHAVTTDGSVTYTLSHLPVVNKEVLPTWVNNFKKGLKIGNVQVMCMGLNSLHFVQRHT
eukprot:3529668-Ditylum_brightwellii.AAC.1